MFLIGIISWWYGNGFIDHIKIIKSRLSASVDFFSISLLVKTLFAPYHQISADNVVGPIGIQMRAFVDRLLSRFIGACARTLMIFLGLITMILQFIFGIIVLVFWLIIPIFPLIGIILMMIGWVPQWTN